MESKKIKSRDWRVATAMLIWRRRWLTSASVILVHILLFSMAAINYDDIPRMPRRNRPVDDPKMVGFWKIGRTLGQGAQGSNTLTTVKVCSNSK